MNSKEKYELQRVFFWIFRPLVLVVGFVLSQTYHLLFGWWLDDRDARKNQENFAEEIRENLAFLFKDGAQLIPYERKYPPAFDNAMVTVAVGNLRFRFARGRGDLQVHITPQHAPRDWHEMATVLMAIDRGFARRPSYYRL